MLVDLAPKENFKKILYNYILYPHEKY
jgi:hypothetical protein